MVEWREKNHVGPPSPLAPRPLVPSPPRPHPVVAAGWCPAREASCCLPVCWQPNRFCGQRIYLGENYLRKNKSITQKDVKGFFRWISPHQFSRKIACVKTQKEHILVTLTLPRKLTERVGSAGAGDGHCLVKYFHLPSSDRIRMIVLTQHACVCTGAREPECHDGAGL